MVDVQQERPLYEMPVNMVGIRGLKYPIRVLDRANEFQETIAEISMFVDLPKHFRGTHMSRFVEVLNKYRSEIAYKELRPILTEMKQTFDARCAHLSMKFPYFIMKEAPVSKSPSFMQYSAFFEARLRNDFVFELGVIVPVSTVCPCSKEISERGAHNQRAEITIKVRFKKFIWLEELIEYAESSASAPLYSMLKRPDEKYITETAYDNPRFVEDVVRAAAQKLIDDDRITYFKVEAESAESIHNHNAYAMIERTK
ncbi:GTP cyclohydrolase I FolE2 [bacterium]|nr:MAG: GTP cyclohydrolase I FolE2 [bacterium]